ncbi:MAG: sensor histidine kinase [Anaerolineales bacterium]
MIPIVVSLFATLLAFAWALYVRQRWGFQPVTLEGLTRFGLTPYAVGFAVQSLTVPIALAYLFSRTPLFEQAIGGEPIAHRFLKLFGTLALLQLLALNYEFWLFSLSPDRVTLGLLVVLMAGMLGGWQLGLSLGLVTVLISAIRLIALFEINLFYPLLSAYQDAGLRGIFDWGIREFFAISHPVLFRALPPLWAGLVGGLWADILGKRRFAPVVALGFGSLIELVAGYLVIVTTEGPFELATRLRPRALILGAGLAAIALMVNGIQAEAARRKAEAANLARTQAELRALRAQINPHFLFNTLNTIRYFVRTDPEIARRLLLDLSEIFQRALRSGEFVPLQDEISYVQSYLSIEKARLDERLRIEWSLPEEAALMEHPVPTLILQPVVENAVLHGIGRKPEGGTVGITIEPVEGNLLLRVEDDGMGITPGQLAAIRAPAREGSQSIGLRNVDGRLHALYGENHRLVLESQIGHGTLVEIKIPL